MKLARRPSKRATGHGTLLVLLSWLALSTGCVRPPELVLQDARMSLRQARNAQAETYAPKAYRAAAQTLSEGLAEIELQKHKTVFSRSYGKAAVLLMKAKKLADGAKSRAETQREEMKAEDEALLKDAHQALEVAREAVEVDGGQGPSRSVLRGRVVSTTAVLSKAENDLADGNYLAAHDEAAEATAQANKIIDEASGEAP